MSRQEAKQQSDDCPTDRKAAAKKSTVERTTATKDAGKKPIGSKPVSGKQVEKKGETVEIRRCPWVDLGKPDYVEYHDKEWGVPVHDDRVIFEFLTLEAAQAGLSWYTVLRKRENYRAAFAGFDPLRVAAFNETTVQELLQNPGIIRNQAKIRAAIHNAAMFLKVQEEFGSFDAYIWRFVDGRPIVHEIVNLADYPTTIPESDALSRDMKQRGFKFLGSTVCYAHMQATGLVNDHSLDCFRRLV